MKLFRFLKKKPDELIVTREVLIEKWIEGGPEVIQSFTRLLKSRIIPTLVMTMHNAGFSSVLLIGTGYDNRNEVWNIEGLNNKRLLSGKSNGDFDIYEHWPEINNFESYSRWATRAEKMVEKISEIKQQVEEMKSVRNSLLHSINEHY